jgi:sarcosine oxidase subunit gamma
MTPREPAEMVEPTPVPTHAPVRLASVPPASRRSPLHGWAERFAVAAPAIVLTEVPFTPMLSVRVDPGSAEAERLESHWGMSLPRSPHTIEVAPSGLTAVWLAPDEFLILGDATSTIDDLAGASAGTSVAVDVSAQRTIIALSGPEARDLLAGGCSVDLDAAVAPTGTSVHTPLAQAGVILLVVDAAAGEFWLIVRSSFAEYVALWLLQGAREYLPVE